MPEPLRIGIVGQSLDAVFLAQAWRELPCVELIPLDTPSDPSDFGRSVRAARLNAVSICSPSGKRLAMIRKVLDEGLPVLAETPWATDIDSVATLLEDRAGRPALPLLPLTPLRFAADVQLARGIIAAGSLGEPGGFEVCLAMPELVAPNMAASEPVSAAGLVMEQSWNALDLIRFAFGEVATVQATRLRSPAASAALEGVDLSVRCSSGWAGKALLSASRSQARPWVLRATASEASLEIGWQESHYKPMDADRTRLGQGCFGVESYRRMAECFAAVASRNGEGWVSDQDVARVTELVQAAHMSLGAGLAVDAPRKQRRIVAA